MPPEIVSTSYRRGRGLVVRGRFACGHVQAVVFPHAGPRVPRRELVAWMFGPRGDERCSRCERLAQAAPACICVGRRPGDLAADDCLALVHVAGG